MPADHAFRVWGYSTTDPLEDVLRPGYFTASGLLHPGELIYVRMQAQPAGRARPLGSEPVRMALVMVVRDGARGVVVRLAQDFGATDEVASVAAASAPPVRAAAEPARRKRGRPSGSRTRKAPATNGHDPAPARIMASAATAEDPSHEDGEAASHDRATVNPSDADENDAGRVGKRADDQRPKRLSSVTSTRRSRPAGSRATGSLAAGHASRAAST